MQVTNKYAFYGAKSGGNTLVALNMAITHQFHDPTKRVAYLQLSRFPDVHTYTGIACTRTILDLKHFIDANEKKSNLLTSIAQHQGVDIFQSPVLNHWENIFESDIKSIIELIETQYDVLYIDVDKSISQSILRSLLQSAQKIILTSNIDPASLAGLESFFSQYEAFRPQCSLLFNQCPPRSLSFINKQVSGRDIEFLGTLPVEEKHMWAQIFDAIPLAFRKKSKWNKALLQVLKKIID